MLYRAHRWELTFAVIALAAAYLAIARMVPLDENADSDGKGGRSLTRLLFAGLALTFVTLAVAECQRVCVKTVILHNCNNSAGIQSAA